MRRFGGLLLAALAGSLVLASAAFAGTLTLHPAGFGPMTYSSWKAQQGEPDSGGSANQALYFQKFVPTTTNAAAVAIVHGIEGLPAADLTGLAWDHREDGHCGAGAPRWNVSYQVPGDPTGSHTMFFGCNAAQHTELSPASGHGWCRDSYSNTAFAFPPGAVITGLAIVFDEGNDTPNPPPAGCNQESLTPGGFVFLDNITVQTTQGTTIWTSARDNGNG